MSQGFLVVTATEDDQNAFHGSTLWFVPENRIAQGNDRLNPPQATRLQPVVRRVSPVGLQPVPLSHRSGISKRVMIIVNDP
jgi:hypothetical protein